MQLFSLVFLKTENQGFVVKPLELSSLMQLADVTPCGTEVPWACHPQSAAGISLDSCHRSTTPHPTRLSLHPELDFQLTHSVPVPFTLAWTEVSGHD